jgi:hypothetical protein
MTFQGLFYEAGYIGYIIRYKCPEIFVPDMFLYFFRKIEINDYSFLV